MTQVNDDLSLRLADFTIRENMEMSLKYLMLLKKDIEEFESFIDSNASVEEKRQAFQRLMTLTLGSTTDWKRLRDLADIGKYGVSTLKRYVLRVSAPVSFMFPRLCKTLKEVIDLEFSEITKTLEPLKKAAEEKRLAEEKEWQEFCDRVFNPLPGTSLNVQAVYAPQDPDATRLLLAYPCRGIYEMSRLYVPICKVCASEGKESAHTHGRLLLSSEDGLLMLPQIVHTQADVLQVIKDLQVNKQSDSSLTLEDETWFEDCKKFLTENAIVQSFPEGKTEETMPRDLSKGNLCWVM